MSWRVINRTREALLGDRVEEARSFSGRFVGLMGRRDLPFGAGLHLVPCNSIHTFFMRIPIDVAFLDREHKVLKLLAAMPPWRASPICVKAHSVLELPAGVFAGSGTQEGDQLAFEKVPPPLC